MTFREKGQQPYAGAALPVYSVDTLEEAEALRTLHCTRTYDESPRWLFRYPPSDGHPLGRPFGRTLDEFDEVAAVLESSLRRLRGARASSDPGRHPRQKPLK